MATYIALLRAVNLGPHNKVSMADLKASMQDLAIRSPSRSYPTPEASPETNFFSTPSSIFVNDLEIGIVNLK